MIENKKEELFYEYIDKAYDYIMDGNLDRAWDNIQLANDINDDRISLYEIKGLYYATIGDYEKAIVYYELAEKYGYVYRYAKEIGILFSHLGEIEKARKVYKALNNTASYDYLFGLELNLCNYEKAKRYLKKWHRSRRKLFKDDEYRVKQSRLLLGQGNNDKALKILNLTRGEEYYAEVLKGCIYLYQGDAVEALTCFKAGAERWPDIIDFYYYGILAAKCTKDNKVENDLFEEGIKQLNCMQRYGLSRKDFFMNFASLYSLSGDFDMAKKYFKLSSSMPMCVYCDCCNCQEVPIRVGIMHYFMGDKELFLEEFAKAEEIKPDDIDIAGFKSLVQNKRL